MAVALGDPYYLSVGKAMTSNTTQRHLMLVGEECSDGVLNKEWRTTPVGYGRRQLYMYLMYRSLI